MSKMLMPIPVGNPVLDNPNSFNIAWQKYLKAIGDDLLTANKVLYVTKQIPDPNDPNKMITVNTGLQYTINANMCVGTYSRPNAYPETVRLPYTSLLGFAIGSTIYPAGTKEVTFGVLDSFVQFWYIVDFTR